MGAFSGFEAESKVGAHGPVVGPHTLVFWDSKCGAFLCKVYIRVYSVT